MEKREAQLRRRAAKLDCNVENSRVKNTHSNNQGGYRLIGVGGNILEGGDYDLNVDRREYWIGRYETELAR